MHLRNSLLVFIGFIASASLHIQASSGKRPLGDRFTYRIGDQLLEKVTKTYSAPFSAVVDEIRATDTVTLDATGRDLSYNGIVLAKKITIVGKNITITETRIAGPSVHDVAVEADVCVVSATGKLKANDVEFAAQSTDLEAKNEIIMDGCETGPELRLKASMATLKKLSGGSFFVEKGETAPPVQTLHFSGNKLTLANSRVRNIIISPARSSSSLSSSNSANNSVAAVAQEEEMPALQGQQSGVEPTVVQVIIQEKSVIDEIKFENCVGNVVVKKESHVRSILFDKLLAGSGNIENMGTVSVDKSSSVKQAKNGRVLIRQPK